MRVGHLSVCFGDMSVQSFAHFLTVFVVVELDEVLNDPGLPVRPKEVAFYPGEHGERTGF